MPTTAARVPVTTGTAIKTMLQIKAFVPLKIIEWGIFFDGFAAALPGRIELIETDVAATVTTLADADISRLDMVADGVAPSVAGLTLGTAATGFTATAEGSITSVRSLDPTAFLPPTGPFVKQFALGREPLIQINKFVRIRVTMGTAVNAYCYAIVST